jgi:hypothetical protein
VDRHRFDADPDPYPNFQFDADPDSDWHQNDVIQMRILPYVFTHIAKTYFFTSVYLSHYFQFTVFYLAH